MQTSPPDAGPVAAAQGPSGRGLRRAAPLLALVLAINAFVLSVAGWSLLESRRQFHQRARATTQNLALALERDVEGTIKQIDTTLLWMKEDLEHRHPGREAEAGESNAFIERQFARAPYLDGLRWSTPKACSSWASA